MREREEVKNRGFQITDYPNGDWEFRDEDLYVHLFRGDTELTEGVKAILCYSYDNGCWEYTDEEGTDCISAASEVDR